MRNNTADSEGPTTGIHQRLLAVCRRLFVGLLVVYWIALFILTHLPAPSSGGAKVNDKAAHFLAYGLLSFLLVWAIRPRTKVWLAGAAIVSVCAAYGVIDELLQALIPSRTADFWDWVADLGGAATGAIVALLALNLWRRFAKAD